MIVDALPAIYDGSHSDEEARTCPDWATLHPGKGPPPDGWVNL